MNEQLGYEAGLQHGRIQERERCEAEVRMRWQPLLLAVKEARRIILAYDPEPKYVFYIAIDAITEAIEQVEKDTP